MSAAAATRRAAWARVAAWGLCEVRRVGASRVQRLRFIRRRVANVAVHNSCDTCRAGGSWEAAGEPGLLGYAARSAQTCTNIAQHV
jgi:hypothetical protein